MARSFPASATFCSPCSQAAEPNSTPRVAGRGFGEGQDRGGKARGVTPEPPDLMPSGRQFDPQRGPNVAAARDQDSHRDPVARLAWRAMPRNMPLKTNRWTG